MMKWNNEKGIFELNENEGIDWPNAHVAELFVNEVDDLRKKHHLDETAVASRFDMDVPILRKTISSAHRVLYDWRKQKAIKLQEGGMSTSMIAYKLGLKESTVRMLLRQDDREKEEA